MNIRLVKQAFIFFLGTLSLSTGCVAPNGRIRTLPKDALPHLEVVELRYESSKPALGEKIGDAQSAELARMFSGALSKDNHRRFRHDPRLDLVARIRAQAWGEHESSPPSTLVNWLLWKFGIVGRPHSSPTWWSLRGQPVERLKIALKKFARKLKVDGERYIFGVSVVKVGSEKYALGVVVVEKLIAFYDLPKHYAPGEMVNIRGKVLVKNRGLDFSMQGGGGEHLNMSVNTDDDDLFLVQVPAPTIPGRYFIGFDVQVKARYADRAVHIPIYVGESERKLPEDAILNPRSNPRNSDAWEEILFERFNALRTENGLPQLKRYDPASQVAKATAKRQAGKCCKRRLSVRNQLGQKGLFPERSAGWLTDTEYLDEYIAKVLTYADFTEDLYDDRYDTIGLGKAKDTEYRLDTTWVATSFLKMTKGRRAIPEKAARILKQGVDQYAGTDAGSRSEHESFPTASLADEYTATLTRETKTEVIYDPALDALAEIYAHFGRVSGPLSRFILWKLGETGKVVKVLRRVRKNDAVSLLKVAELKNEIMWDEDTAKKHYRLGIAEVPLLTGAFTEVIVLVGRDIELRKPLAKKFKPGELVTLRGRFLYDARHPYYWEDNGGKDIRAIPLEMTKDKRFTMQLTAPEKPGRYFLEISTFQDEANEEKLKLDVYHRNNLLIPIYVGMEEPERIDDYFLNPPSNPVDLTSWADYITQEYNEERRKHGLPEFESHWLAEHLSRDYHYQNDNSDENYPDYDEISEQISRNNTGRMFAWMSSIVFNVAEKTRWSLLIPSSRDSILDKRATGFNAVFDSDYLFLVETFMSPPTEDGKDSEGRFKFSSLGVVEDWQPPAKGTISAKKLEKVYKENRKDIEKCYQEKVDDDNPLKGKIVLNLVIGTTGRVIASYVDSVTFDHVFLERCIVEKTRQWVFPAPMGKGPFETQKSFKVSKALR